MTIEWYYTKGNQQLGPVTPAELRQLAEQRELGPETAVWREGMEEWVPAKRVKGLFDGEAGALPGEAAPARSSRAAFERSAAAFERARQRSSHHLFDWLLDRARTRFTGQFVAMTARLFGLVGHYSLYAAMAALLAAHSVLGMRTGLGLPILLGGAEVVALVVLQYAAGRFSAALERLDRATTARMTSPAFLDCFALLNLVLGLVALLAFSLFAAETEMFGWLFTAVAAFIVCQYAAAVALNPEAMQLTVTSDADPTEEAMALCSFFAKFVLRTIPVCYGLGAVWGTVLLGAATALLVRAPRLDAPESVFGSFSPASLVLPSSGTVSASDLVTAAVVLLLATAALPIVAYFGFLAYHVALSVLQALLALPNACKTGVRKGTEKDE